MYLKIKNNLTTCLFILLLILAHFSCKKTQSTSLYNKVETYTPQFKFLATIDSLQLTRELSIQNLPEIKVSNPKFFDIDQNKKFISSGKQAEYLLKEVSLVQPAEISLTNIKIHTQNQPFESKPAKEMASKDRNSESFTSFDKLQGLSHSFVPSMIQDAEGTIWFGTHNGGVTKYDGKYFDYINTNSGLSSNVVYAMKQMKNKEIWIGSNDNGLSVYDGQSFMGINVDNGLPSPLIYDIDEGANNKKWIASHGGLILFTGDQKNRIKLYNKENGLVTDSIASVKEDSKGTVWIGTEGKGIYCLKGDKIHQFSAIAELNQAIVTKIIESKNGTIWATTYGNGLIKIKDSSYSLFTTGDGLPSNNLTSIIENSKGEIWVGTDGEGVFNISENGTNNRTLTSFTQNQGLTNNNVYSLLEDKNGNVWVGTLRGGVNKYNGDKFTHIQNDQGFSFQIFTITEDANQYWLGSSGSGVIKINKEKNKFANISKKEGLSDVILSSVKDANGNIWLGTRDEGLIIYDGDKYKKLTEEHGLPSNKIYKLKEDSSKNIWIATSQGFSKFDGNKLVTQKNSNQTVNKDIYNILEIKTDHLWFGTEGNGIIQKENDKLSKLTIKGNAGLNVIFDMTKDADGNIWIGTESGILLFDGKLLYNIIDAHGLANNYVLSLLYDKQGNLWFGTRTGVSLLSAKKRKQLIASLQQNQGLSDGMIFFKNYNYEDGFTGIGCNRGALTQTNDGTVWIGTTDKLSLSVLGKDSLRDQNDAPHIQIKEVSVFNEKIHYNFFKKDHNHQQNLPNGIRVKDIRFSGYSKWNAIPVNLSLKHDNNYLSFICTGITQSQPDKVTYSYKLSGLKEEYSGYTKDNVAHYSNLSPGKYTFSAIAKDAEGNISKEIKYSFIIRQPWWYTWWMKILYGLIAGIIIYYLHLNQKARTIKNERIKSQAKELEQAKEIERAYTELKEAQEQLIQAEKMASLGELTAGISHEIQNPLNFINNFAEVSSEMIEDIHEEIKNNDLKEIAELADLLKVNLDKITHHGKRAESIVRSMLLHSRNSIGQKELTDINALCDEYMRLSYHGYRAKDKSFNADFSLDTDESIPHIMVVPQDLGRVILNILNNAFYAVNQKKHEPDCPSDFKPKVLLTTLLLSDKVRISIKDNGHGIPEALINKIFQPFYTTKPTGQGTGLGLSLAYDIISKHDGTIDVKSHPGLGTEFIIELPVKKT